MNYNMGSGILRYIRASKTFSKFRALRSSVRFEVQCASKFRAFRRSVRFEVPCASKFRAFRCSVRFEVPCTSKFRAVTIQDILYTVCCIVYSVYIIATSPFQIYSMVTLYDTLHEVIHSLYSLYFDKHLYQTAFSYTPNLNIIVLTESQSNKQAYVILV